jgi:hypothetical protein
MDSKKADFLQINVTRPPKMMFASVKLLTGRLIRTRGLLAQDRKPLTAFTPGYFPGYPQPKGDEFNPEKRGSFG